MKQNKQMNLTEGPILKTLTGLALPIMASSFLGTLYSITDMAWIGLLGAKAVAGVGVGGMFVWLSQGLSSLARMGGQVHVAQFYGQGKKEEARQYAKAAIWLSIVFALLFSAACVAFTDPLIGFFNLGDRETIEAAVKYMKITCGLLIFSYLNVTLTGIYTAQGDSRTPFFANLIGLAVNMALDPVLILGVGPFPRMEVTGAAAATVAAQFIVMMALILGILRAKREENVLRDMKLFRLPGKQYFSDVCRMGGPTALQGTVYCMISMVLTRMISAFGPEAVATQRLGGQIEAVSWNTADGFAAALNAFCGQNYGARRMDRVREGYRISFRTIVIWGVFISLVFILFPAPIAGIFFHEAGVIRIAVSYLIIVGFSEAFMCVELMTIGALSGLGLTKLCSVISILLTGARIPMAYVLSRTPLGLDGIWWALTLSSVAKGIVFYLAFQAKTRKSV